MIVKACLTELFYLIGVDLLRICGCEISVIAERTLLLGQLCGAIVIGDAVNPFGVLGIAAKSITVGGEAVRSAVYHWYHCMSIAR